MFLLQRREKGPAVGSGQRVRRLQEKRSAQVVPEEDRGLPGNCSQAFEGPADGSTSSKQLIKIITNSVGLGPICSFDLHQTHKTSGNVALWVTSAPGFDRISSSSAFFCVCVCV